MSFLDLCRSRGIAEENLRPEWIAKEYGEIDASIVAAEIEQARFDTRTITLQHMGDFYEVQSLRDETTGDWVYGTGKDFADTMDARIASTTPTKTSKIIPRLQAYMAGFPARAFENNWDQRLLQAGQKIVVQRQAPNDVLDTRTNKFKRVRTIAISPGTYFNDSGEHNNNFIVAIQIRRDAPQRNSSLAASRRLLFDIVIADLSVGRLFMRSKTVEDRPVEEFWEPVYQEVSLQRPHEIWIWTPPHFQHNRETVARKIGAPAECQVEFRQTHPLATRECAIADTIMRERFLPSTMAHITEHFPTEDAMQCMRRFVLMMREMNETLLQQLGRKIVNLDDTESVFFGNNALAQLSVFPATRGEKKTDQLYGILNGCVTGMGKRRLSDWLRQPAVTAANIRERQRLTELGLAAPNLRALETHLRDIPDIERTMRDIEISGVTLPRIDALATAFRAIDHLSEQPSVAEILTPEIQSIQRTFREEWDTLVNMDFHYSLDYCDGDGIYWKKSTEERDEGTDVVSLVRVLVTDNLLSGQRVFADAVNRLQALGGTPRVDYDTFEITITKAERNKKSMKDVYGRTGEFPASAVANTGKAGETIYVSNAEISRAREVIQTERERLKEGVTRGVEMITGFLRRTDVVECLDQIVEVVTNIDMMQNGAGMVAKLRLTKPTVTDGERGCLRVVGVKHPVIMNMTMATYVGNDVSLGGDCGTGSLLLQGVNASGKSCLMKAVGLAVIMAQAGLQVPAERMDLVPYRKIMTRIVGRDNMIRGQSSFAVEMNELKTILGAADERTLVLGDELCAGTEHPSAMAIVSASLRYLTDRGASTMLATHLHGLMDVDVLKGDETIAERHMTVVFNAAADCLEYGQRMVEGGGRVLYGVEVARGMGLPPVVLETAMRVRDEMGFRERGSNETSAQNPAVAVMRCEVCGSSSDLTTHHIRRQCEGGGGEQANLVTLCRTCHDHVDRTGELEISGQKMTSAGRQLDQKVLTEEEAASARSAGSTPIGGRSRVQTEEVVEIIRGMRNMKPAAIRDVLARRFAGTGKRFTVSGITKVLREKC